MQRCSALILAMLVSCWAGGCAAPLAPSYGPSVSVQGTAAAPTGGRWEVVFPGGDTGPALAAGPEASRLDAAMVREGVNVIEDSYWPEPRANSLHRLRRHYFRGHPGEVPYFREPIPWVYPPAPHAYRGWGW